MALSYISPAFHTFYGLPLIIIMIACIYYFLGGKFMLKEGLKTKEEYVDPDLSSDPIYLSRLNAANITFLKSQLDEITSLKRNILEMKDKVDANSFAVEKINSSMQDMAKQAIPSKSVTSGLVDTVQS